MKKKIKAEQIVRIDPKGKYILVLPEGTPKADAEAILDALREWYASDRPIALVIGGKIVHLAKARRTKARRS